MLARYGRDAEIVVFPVDSNVSTLPTGDDEALRGCHNRIESARRERPGADLYVALEGLVAANEAGTFIFGWCVVHAEADKRCGYGCSAKVLLPKDMAEVLTPSSDVAREVERRYGESARDALSEIGTNGVITNGLYTRVDEFDDAINCALGYLLNERNFAHGDLAEER